MTIAKIKFNIKKTIAKTQIIKICESAVKNKKVVPLSLSGKKYVTKQLNLLLTPI